MAPSISQNQVAGLWYVTSIDNSADPAFDLTLLKFDQTTLTFTMSDSSTNDLTEWLSDRAVTLLTNSLTVDLLAILHATVSIQTINTEATPVNKIVPDVDPNILLFQVEIPAPYYGGFVWGAPHSIEGGFAMPGCGVAGGGSTVLSVTATDPLVSSGGANPNIAIKTAGAAADDVLKYDGAAWVIGPVPGGGGGSPTGPAGGVLGYVESDGVTNPSTYPNPNGLAGFDVGGSPTVKRVPIRDSDPLTNTIEISPDTGPTGPSNFRIKPGDGLDAAGATNATPGGGMEVRASNGGNADAVDGTATGLAGFGGTAVSIGGNGGHAGANPAADAGIGGDAFHQAGDGGYAIDGGGAAADGGDTWTVAGDGGAGSTTQKAADGGRGLTYGGDAGADGGAGGGKGGPLMRFAGVSSDGSPNGRFLEYGVTAWPCDVPITITSNNDQLGNVERGTIEIAASDPFTLNNAPLLNNGREDGERLLIMNVSAPATPPDPPNDITLVGQTNLKIGGGGTRVLGENGGSILLHWSETLTAWVEISYTGSVS